MWYKIYFIGKLKIILIVNEIIFFLLQYCNSITWNPGPGSCLRNNSRMRGSMLSLTWVGIIFVIILHRAKIIFVIILHRAKARCKILTNIMPTHVKISIEPGILRNNSRMPGCMVILTWVGIIFVIILHRAIGVK